MPAFDDGRTFLFNRKACLTLATLLFIVSSSLSVFAEADSKSWNQFRGPNRDGHAASASLLKKWPAGGPKLAWSYKNLGTGFSASAVSEGRLFTMGTHDEKCHVICLDVKSGKLIWETPFDGNAKEGDYNLGWGGGPRGTPTVVGDKLFALSDLGTLTCMKSADGSILWSTNLVKDHGGSIPTWGYSESVLVDGDRVIVTPGGANFLIGLDANTGKKVWSSQEVDMPAQYVSVIKATFGSKSMYITASKPGLVAVDVDTGKLLFQEESTGNKTAVIPSPVVMGDIVYHVSAYGAGNMALKVTVDGDKVSTSRLYHRPVKSMENHHGGVILHDGAVFGFSKTDRGVWMAEDVASGEVLWSRKVGSNTSGSIAFADGMFYCYNDKDGTCFLIEASRDGWKPKGELTLPAQTELPRYKGAIWAHPIVSDGLLIIRDLDLLFAYNIAK
jgi:outer membrane protein assembly factor BamB